MQVQGQHPHQWAPFPDSWLAARLAGLTPDLQVCLSWGLIAESFHSLQSPSVSCFPVILGFPSTCMSKAVLTAPLERSTYPYLHTIGVFSPPEPQCQAAQVAHWTWWCQCLAAWHCRSVWSLPCHLAADAGGLALSMAKSRWHGALRSTHKSCTHSHVFWKRGGMKRELVADPWISSRRFHTLKVHSHLLLRACLLGNKRKLPPEACQVWPGLPSVVCHPRGVQFPGTVYICSQGLLSSAWAHCISGLAYWSHWHVQYLCMSNFRTKT